MAPTKARNPNEQLRLEKKKFEAKEKKSKEETNTKKQSLLKMGNKSGQTKL